MSKNDPKVVFLTGAGLSADSGLKTYRGDDGVYNGVRVEKLISAYAMKNTPDVVQQFNDDQRVSLKGVKPNKAHGLISSLSREFGDRVIHFTQNVDGLSPEAIELHGRQTRLRSIGNSHVTVDIGPTRYWGGDAADECPGGFRFRCPKTNSHFRPDVVLFDEVAPNYAKLWKTMSSLRRHDLFVVIGTMGNVLPVSEMAKRAPCKTILNNLHKSDDIDESDFDVVLLDRAVVAADEIEAIIREHLMATQANNEAAKIR